MHLVPRELDKLTLHAAGFLAQKRLARGLRLNYPEAVALLSTQLLELIRDGRSVAELAGTFGYVFQNPSQMLFAPTVREEILFGPRNFGRDQSAWDGLVAAFQATA